MKEHMSHVDKDYLKKNPMLAKMMTNIMNK